MGRQGNGKRDVSLPTKGRKLFTDEEDGAGEVRLTQNG